MSEQRTSKPESNRDKVLRGEVVVVSDGRLREMQEQAIRLEGIGDGTYHWHWAAVMNELIARRAADETAAVRRCDCGCHRSPHGLCMECCAGA